MTRGEVWWADLAPRSGAEQHRRRPVIVMSHDAFNRVASWRSVIIVPLSTSATQALRGPTAVPVAAGVANLPLPSMALCHQVTTLNRSRLVERLGRLPAADLHAVEEGLTVALDLD